MAYCRWSDGVWYAFPTSLEGDETLLALWHKSKGQHVYFTREECRVLMHGGALLDDSYDAPLTAEERQDAMEVVLEFVDEYDPDSKEGLER